MFESLIGLAGPLINALYRIKIKKSDKKSIGQGLAKLYVGLREIIENGEVILQLLEDGQRNVQVDISTLRSLLFAQADRIRRIRSIVEKSHLATILKIHLPQLIDLQILLEMKGDRIAVLTEQLEAQKLHRFRPVTLYDSLSHRMKWVTKLVPPTEEPLKKAYLDLNELKRLADLLRQFLVERFEIDEVI